MGYRSDFGSQTAVRCWVLMRTRADDFSRSDSSNSSDDSRVLRAWSSGEKPASSSLKDSKGSKKDDPVAQIIEKILALAHSKVRERIRS